MNFRRAGAVLAATALVVGVAPAVWTSFVSAGRQVELAAAPKQPVIVFGAALNPTDGTPKAFLSARLDIAKKLFDEGKTDRIIVSGATAPYYSEPRSMRLYLQKVGVPADVIEQDDHGYDTYDTCIRARDVFGLKKATLATQSYHLPRALAICSTLGVDAVGVGDDTARKWPQYWWPGVAREYAANFKMVWDLASGRPPQVRD